MPFVPLDQAFWGNYHHQEYSFLLLFVTDKCSWGRVFMCSKCLEIVLVNNVLASCIWFLRLKLILTTIDTMGSKLLSNASTIPFVVLSGIVTRSELP